jgi:hypothetical protein
MLQFFGLLRKVEKIFVLRRVSFVILLQKQVCWNWRMSLGTYIKNIRTSTEIKDLFFTGLMQKQ